MKTLILTLAMQCFLVCSLSAQTASTVTTTTPLQATGTITTFNPTGEIVTVTTPGVTDPVSYTYVKTTTIVDEAGNPVAIETVKTGVPTTIYYEKNGDKLIVSKMVVKSVPVTQQTTTTTITK